MYNKLVSDFNIAYTYIYMYIRVYTCIYVYIRRFPHSSFFIQTVNHVVKLIYMYMRVYKFYTCICEYIHVYIHIYTCIYAPYIYMYIRTVYIHVYTSIYMDIRVYTCQGFVKSKVCIYGRWLRDPVCGSSLSRNDE